MLLLSIETSCDETAIAITQQDDQSPFSAITVLSNKIVSQIDIHKEFGGVFPALAKREHAKAIVPLFLSALREARIASEKNVSDINLEKLNALKTLLEREPEMFEDIKSHVAEIKTLPFDAIAVTVGPGLEPALWVGINFAKALSYWFDIPLFPMNHMEGHLLAGAVERVDHDNAHTVVSLHPINYPMLALLVSGGHTELIKISSIGAYTLIGETLDDAVGEAFDKVARLLGLPYPGGPEIARLASQATEVSPFLPRPMKHSPDYNFSFSGLKTAVRYHIQKLEHFDDAEKIRTAHDFQNACIEVLTHKTVRACKEFDIQTVVLGGGVSANTLLKDTLSSALAEIGIPLLTPPRGLSTDNALMIAIAAHICPRPAVDRTTLRAQGHMRIFD